ncbi:minor virion protein [Clavavirus yamagawaense]|uniref:Minor virion protein n=1 Tax=Aeropyrum pernix bacilliform virus 1 (isolate -/Japan/Tanaka/2005) TaxID=1289471 RepID=D4QF75_APBV1|nr:minor virion protein [Aeropyrum pernix bacilliform virus 1]BAJ06119.1 minor virion protein [Aeropyrum pernix bacilliform virus 1]
MKVAEPLKLAIIFFFIVIVYYGLLFDLVVDMLNQAVSLIDSYGLLTVNVPMKDWDPANQVWVDSSKQVNLSGVAQALANLLAYAAPFIPFISFMRRRIF